MQFTVKRSEWYRGKGAAPSKLLRTDGTRCCIGFVGQQCGIADSALLNRRTIGLCPPKDEKWPTWTNSNDIADTYEAYEVNDNAKLNDKEREAKLKEIFARNGDEIVFVD